MFSMAKVVVLGAGFAGVNVCLNLIGSEHDVELLDVNGSHEFTPGIIDLFRERHDEDDLRVNLNRLFKDTDIEFFRESVEDIDPQDQRVETNAGSHDYTYLVVALGAEAATYGVDVSAADKFYSLTSAKRSVKNVEEAEEVTVIGSGYVGVEVAAEIREMGKDVTVIDGSTRPLPAGNEDSSLKILNYMNRHDITFKGGSPAKRIEENKTVLENGKSIEHDACIWSAGIKTSETVQDALDVGRDGVPVDDYLRWEKYPEVFALGDCADVDVIDTAHNAIDQAKFVAANIGRSKSKMKKYDSSETPLLISLGDTGMMLYGDRALKNRLFRRMKDYVMKGYKMNLKRKKLRARL